MMRETRFNQLARLKGPEGAKELFEQCKADAQRRRHRLESLAEKGE